VSKTITESFPLDEWKIIGYRDSIIVPGYKHRGMIGIKCPACRHENIGHFVVDWDYVCSGCGSKLLTRRDRLICTIETKGTQ